MSPTVLYIEDHPDNMTLVRRILQSESYTLIEAMTGFQGILFAESQDIDVILLDINLPDIDRLGHIHITACIQRFFGIAFQRVSGHGNDRHRFQFALVTGAKTPRHLISINVGQIDIQ